MIFIASLFRLDTLQQTKARLELANQTLKQSHGQELEGREQVEGREQELEQVKNTMGKKLKSLNQQLEEVHEQKHAAVKVRTTSLLCLYTIYTCMFIG